MRYIVVQRHWHAGQERMDFTPAYLLRRGG